jgi:hypothetical protein
MSFFKSLLLAILATLFLTYVFGVSMTELFDIDLYIDNELVEPIKAISLSALAAVVLVIVALAIVLSVFGSIIFITLLVFGCVAMVMVGVFWPVLLIAAIIWLITGPSRKRVASV